MVNPTYAAVYPYSMPRRSKKKNWWEEPRTPRKPNRDEIEEAEVKAVIAELPQDCEAVKAYAAGADTAQLSHLVPKDRPDLLRRLLRAMNKGQGRHWERTKHLHASCAHRVKPRDE
jgi:hypothetical protein